MKNILLIFLSISIIYSSAQNETKTYYDANFKSINEPSKAIYYETARTAGTKKIHPIKIFFISGDIYQESTPGAFMENGKSSGCWIIFNKNGTIETEQCFEQDVLILPNKTYPKVQQSKMWGDKCEGCKLPRDSMSNEIEFSVVVNHAGTAENLYKKAATVLTGFENIGQVENKIDLYKDEKKVTRRFTFDLYYGIHSDHVTDQIKFQKRGTVVYRISVYCKDNKYKIRAHDFKFVVNNSTGTSSIDQVIKSASEKYGMGLMNNNEEQITNTIIKMINGASPKDEPDKLGRIEEIEWKMLTFLSTMEAKAGGKDRQSDF